ncbi:Putative MetA-pathway of phenol degradation [Aquimarina amphilecti]|uniref:Putative MetA-pathway of phenol degradation n=2 Tax=Aquimarina amphilecti TaxID=1038014 RepID=A0A1H7XBW1_AQUAM|nr:Putative MetA-pathway of phenol degradation [Aquimarina amphilecti]
MIKSAIFEPNLLNMSPKFMLLLVSLFLLGFTASAQYTEKINTNRPGTSQGAFSVGNNVLQLEGGFGIGKEKHKLFNTKTNTFNFDYAIRYGLLIEQLEININGSFRSEGIRQTVGANEEKIRRTDFEYNTIGVKYLIYDPYKKPKENDSINYDELKSWKERYRFKWKNLIPAVSAYVGMNYVNTDNPFTFTNDQTISPKIVVMTQNNWWTSNAGSWVLVTNLIVDKITTDNPAYGWIITSTHTLNDKWAVFGEYQGQKSDFYSDNIIRLGGAYLFNNDLQIDANIATNFKDTPSIFRVSVGASYRFDWHNKDEIIEKPGFESGIKGKEDEEELNKKESDSLNIDQEFEEIENDSLKLEKTPFINEFEDGSHRNAMEQDLDERRTEQRLERERIEKEKQDKKDDKKFQKEERRRLKREAKEAKKAEKAKIKAEKEKQKMIEDIDAELDKMEQDEGVDDELKQIDDELKKLEEMEKDLEPEKPKEEEKKKDKEVEEEEDIDAAYEKLQKEQEKVKKEEEKRRKKEEKKRLKEEKKRKKEEEKRKKAEEKKKKKEEEEKENESDNEG